jgi:hypothetical protein
MKAEPEPRPIHGREALIYGPRNARLPPGAKGPRCGCFMCRSLLPRKDTKKLIHARWRMRDKAEERLWWKAYA